MKIDTASAHITPVGGNVFADLGFEPAEAHALKSESDRIISAKVAIKQMLMAELVGWINEADLKQAQAAEILGVTRPRVSDVVTKKSVNFTIDALVEMVTRTGKSVRISVG